MLRANHTIKSRVRTGLKIVKSYRECLSTFLRGNSSVRPHGTFSDPRKVRDKHWHGLSVSHEGVL